MKENLNLVEILKDAPKGTKLWSPICGECTLVEVLNGENLHPIICMTKTEGGDTCHESFSADGKFFADYKNGECVLFPAKENRDWSTFKAPNTHKHFEPFQKVLVRLYVTSGEYIWSCALYSHYDESMGRHYLVNFSFITNDDYIMSYEGNEDKLGKAVE